jgi:hypothetical protein
MPDIDPRDPYGLRGKVQLCLRCGRHEAAGSFCTFCLTAEYDLADHDPHAHGFPDDWFPDPVHAVKAEIKRARPIVWPAGAAVRIRHHPQHPGYTVATDPPVPSWVMESRSQDAPSCEADPETVSTAVPDDKRETRAA